MDISKSNIPDTYRVGFEGGPEIEVPRGRSRPRKYRVQEVIEALQVSKGLKSVAARRLGCSYEVVKRWCDQNAAVRKECEAQLEASIDSAYLTVLAAVSRGDLGASMFILKTLGRSRGFSERTEVTGKDGGPIEHTHIHLWEERLQAVHTQMAAKKAAILLEKQAGGGYAEPVDTA